MTGNLMAYLNQKQYDYRRESAAARNLNNEEIAVEHGMSEEQAELLCAEYHVTELKGVILDELPQNGGLFDYNDINKI